MDLLTGIFSASGQCNRQRQEIMSRRYCDGASHGGSIPPAEVVDGLSTLG